MRVGVRYRYTHAPAAQSRLSGVYLVLALAAGVILGVGVFVLVRNIHPGDAVRPTVDTPFIRISTPWTDPLPTVPPALDPRANHLVPLTEPTGTWRVIRRRNGLYEVFETLNEEEARAMYWATPYQEEPRLYGPDVKPRLTPVGQIHPGWTPWEGTP